MEGYFTAHSEDMNVNNQIVFEIYAFSINLTLPRLPELTHWGRVTHICVGEQTIIASDNGLSPGRRQAIISTNARILLIGPLGKNFSEISIKIITFSFTKMRLKVSSAKWRPFCLGLNVLRQHKWQLCGNCLTIMILTFEMICYWQEYVYIYVHIAFFS